MHRRRGGEVRKRGINRRGVTPGIDRYPSLAAGFRRRALFFEKPTIRQIRATSTPLVISISSAWIQLRSRPLRLRDRGSERFEMTVPAGLAVARGQFRKGDAPVNFGTGSVWAAPCYRSR